MDSILFFRQTNLKIYQGLWLFVIVHKQKTTVYKKKSWDIKIKI